MQKLCALIGILSLAACSKDKDAGAAPAAAASAIAAAPASPPAAAAPTPAASAAPVAAPTSGGNAIMGDVVFGPAGPVVIDPPVQLKQGEGGDHTTFHGWAADSSELGYCSENAGTGAHDCGFLKPGGKVESVSDFDPAAGGLNDAKSKAIHSRLVAKGYKSEAATWVYAQEMRLTWRAVASMGDKPGVLRVGALLNGETEPVLPIYAEAKNALGFHPDAIAISPDDKFVGVVSHGAAGEGGNQYDLKAMALSTLVGQVFNDSALAHHKKGDYERAAALFHKAMAADPANTLAPYNYACALARLKSPAAEGALKAAIAIGGDKIKAKAAKDSDFADVKSEAWFAALVK